MDTKLKGLRLFIIIIAGILLIVFSVETFLNFDLFADENKNTAVTTQTSEQNSDDVGEDSTAISTTDIEEDTTPFSTTEEEDDDSLDSEEKETITFTSLDDITITADLYKLDETSPIILLFHRARWSRGEYIEIAPKLNALGYNVMAVDARSGQEINGIKNETNALAFYYGYGTEFPDAAVDVESSIQYARDELGYNEIITWGSSYSATLVLDLSQNYSEIVKGVIAFSPVDYIVENKTTDEYVSNLTLPTFITGQRGEEGGFRVIYDHVASEDKVIFVPESIGAHGSRALWEETDNYEEYWVAVTAFLNSLE